MNTGEGTNKSERIRIESRDLTFTVRGSYTCVLSYLLGGWTAMVSMYRLVLLLELQLGPSSPLSEAERTNQKIRINVKERTSSCLIPDLNTQHLLGNGSTVNEACFMRVLAELTNCNVK